MKSAIIALQGRQYVVTEGTRLTVDRLAVEEGGTVQVPALLELSDEGIADASGMVTLTALSNEKAPKVIVRRFKAKSRYRKNKGHRQPITKLIVSGLGAEGASKKAEPVVAVEE